MEPKFESFYSVKYGSSIITSNVCQTISVMKTKTLVFPEKWYFKNSSFWHFNSFFELSIIFLHNNEFIRCFHQFFQWNILNLSRKNFLLFSQFAIWKINHNKYSLQICNSMNSILNRSCEKSWYKTKKGRSF